VLVHITTVPETLDFLAGQVGAMKAWGFEVHAISSPGEKLEAFSSRTQVEVHAISMQRRITPLRDLRALTGLWRLLRRLRPQIVHAHTPKGGLLGMVAAWLALVPVRVYTLHGLPLMTATGWKRHLLWWCERTSCRLAHEVFCVSHSLREVVEQERMCPPAKLLVLGEGSTGGVDSARFDPSRFDRAERLAIRERLGLPDATIVIGFVGRIVRDKGVVELMEAWKALRDEQAGLHLLVVGPFENQDPVPAPVEEAMRRDPRIHLTGSVVDTPPLYAAMDVMALPTYREGFSQTLLEAAAMGLPVVASRVPGCVDPVQDGVTGTLVPARDARALEGALRRYLSQPEMRRVHGRAGRERVLRDFRPESIWDLTYRAYAELLQKRGLPRPRPTAVADAEPTGHATKRPNAWSRGIKRVMDLLVALTGLVVFAPVMAIVALAVRGSMGRPVLFCQIRPGRQGVPFVLVKFRTMREAYGPDGMPLPDAERMTWLGRFLRRSSLDELPQLWNVLKGEMSIVGPRPLLPEYMPHYSERQSRRHEVRPGITGLAQVSGRNLLPWDERLELDVKYVESVSLWLDSMILFRTALKALRGSGFGLDEGRFDVLTAEKKAAEGLRIRLRSRRESTDPPRSSEEHPGQTPIAKPGEPRC